MKTRVKVAGLKNLEKSLAGLEKTATKRTVARKALKFGAEPFVDTYRRLAPYDEGHLRRGISVGITLSKRQRKMHRKKDPVEVFAGAENDVTATAVNQEFGNIRHGAQPAARPAWNSQKRNMLARIENVLEDEVDKAVNRQAKRKAKGK